MTRNNVPNFGGSTPVVVHRHEVHVLQMQRKTSTSRTDETLRAGDATNSKERPGRVFLIQRRGQDITDGIAEVPSLKKLRNWNVQFENRITVSSLKKLRNWNVQFENRITESIEKSHLTQPLRRQPEKVKESPTRTL
jgi:hypothetical protein